MRNMLLPARIEKLTRQITYRAPALEKGLDVLQALSDARSPLTLTQISTKLGRSVTELFRMVQVLEMREYVRASPSGEYEITNKLFDIALSSRATRRLITCAKPLMDALSEACFQACHLVVASNDEIVVIARMEAPGQLGLNIRVGFRRKIVGSASGMILYAFQRPEIQNQWRAALQPQLTEPEWVAFESGAERALSDGFTHATSHYTGAIIDLSCPVFAGDEVVAALTIPHLWTNDRTGLGDRAGDLEFCTSTLRQTARVMTDALVEALAIKST
jgi:DNA-binding IclR family transcriptional regulator